MDQSTIILIISFSVIAVLALIILCSAAIHRTCSYSKRQLAKSNNARDWKYDAEEALESSEERERAGILVPPPPLPASAVPGAASPRDRPSRTTSPARRSIVGGKLQKQNRRKTAMSGIVEGGGGSDTGGAKEEIRYYDLGDGSETELPMNRLPPPSLWGRG